MYGEVEGTGFDRIDPRFDACLTGHGRVERLWSGARWLEGPVWFAAGRYLLISDIPNNRLLRWDDTDDSMSVFRTPSNYCNGNTIDQQGRLITCEHITRRVTRTEHDGSIRVLADEFNGKRRNSPNDVVVKSDGSVWFTDPTYGILSDYEGRRAPAEQSGCHVYRIDPETSDITQVTRDFMQPNGLAFDPDETALFISDTGASHAENGPKQIRKFSLGENGQTLGESTVFAECSAGLFDGFRFDPLS